MNATELLQAIVSSLPMEKKQAVMTDEYDADGLRLVMVKNAAHFLNESTNEIFDFLTTLTFFNPNDANNPTPAGFRI